MERGVSAGLKMPELIRGRCLVNYIVIKIQSQEESRSDMIKVLAVLLLLLSVLPSGAQEKAAGAGILSESQTEEILTEEVKSRLGIRYPVYRVYSYEDKAGRHLLVLTEREYKTQGDKPFHDSIMAFCIKKVEDSFSLEWKMKDFILAQHEEQSIWFWTKYFDLEDFDKDGIVDPIVIYGSSGINGTDDGRVKILVYYRGEKRAIRHQNGVLDPQRHTRIDSQFYSLPMEIRQHVREVMERMTEDGVTIFPAGYEKCMEAGERYCDEGQ